MSISEPLIRRPIATSLLGIGLLLVGAVAFFSLPVAPLPQRVAQPLAAAGPSLFEPTAEAPAAAGQPPEQRRHELQMLAERVSSCPRCAELVSTRTQPVFGVGPIDPPLLLIGEAPGADEDRLGEPFVGAAGQLLNRILAACGFERAEVYICNVIKCRPPGNRTPQPDEVRNCSEYLQRQIALVRPKVICALGGCAAQNLLGSSLSLGKLRDTTAQELIIRFVAGAATSVASGLVTLGFGPINVRP